MGLNEIKDVIMYYSANERGKKSKYPAWEDAAAAWKRLDGVDFLKKEQLI